MKLPLAMVLGVAIVVPCGAAQAELPTDRLHLAALEGDAAQVRALLEAGTDVNRRDPDGRTPLIWASLVTRREAVDTAAGVERDYDSVARLLLDRGADVNASDAAGRTALLMAVDGSASEYKVIGADEDLARLLIERGANVNAQDREGWSALLKAENLWADQPEFLAFLLGHGANTNARLKDGRTALMLAARLGKTDRLGPLIAKGADVNASDDTGRTALATAAAVRWEDASVEMMGVLLAHGADPNRAGRDGKTAVDIAAEAGYLSRVQFLLKNGAKTAEPRAFLVRARNQALRREIEEGSVETAATLLDGGADADFRDSSGRTLLMAAADNEYSAAKVKLLLAHGASVNEVGPEKVTALMVAADRYQAESVEVLLAHGADPNAVDSEGNSVLLRAAASRQSWREERQPLIHLLLQKGADVNRKNAQGATALMLMAAEGNPALDLVLKNGAAIGERDAEGNTALLYGARFFARGWPRRNGWSLVQAGADVNAANRRGETALILAATQFEEDAVRFLIAAGAAVNAKSESGRTALMQAIDEPKDFDNDRHVVYSPAIARLLIAAGADVNARDREGNTPLGLALRRGYTDMAAELRRAGAKE